MKENMTNERKKLLLLGGLFYLIPVIEAAHRLDVHVITCDYLPDNIAHKYSDEYHNVSIVDKDAVLELARMLKIDGIMSFAVDPGVETAAYVAEKMGLPFAGSYESVRILQNKDLFRKFLTDNGFNVPVSGAYNEYEQAVTDIGRFRFPVIVKPTDSAGSKGVTRVDGVSKLKEAFDFAKRHSAKGKVIVEEFIEKRGCSSDCDSFSVDGKMVYTTFNAQHFDKNAENPYTPSAYSWPSTFTEEEERNLSSEIQRLVKLLDLKTSIFNIETRIGTNGTPYIMEMSPRGGGNRLAEMERHISGNDMIDAAVCGALNMPILPFKHVDLNGYWSEIVLHSDEETEGQFKGIEISPRMKIYERNLDLYVMRGETIRPFHGANDAIGTLVMNFPDKETMEWALANQQEWIKIILN